MKIFEIPSFYICLSCRIDKNTALYFQERRMIFIQTAITSIQNMSKMATYALNKNKIGKLKITFSWLIIISKTE